MSTMARPPVSDSLEFWLYLFCTAGLVMLALIGPKYQRRQMQIERQYQARVRATELARTGQAETPVSDVDNLLIDLRPLLLLLGTILAAAWARFWYLRFHRPSSSDRPTMSPENTRSGGTALSQGKSLRGVPKHELDP